MLNEKKSDTIKEEVKADNRVYRDYKDRVFCDLFSDKENALSLYNAITKNNYSDTSEVKIKVMPNSIFLGYRNDGGIFVDSRYVLWEHQSTENPNMPLRGLIYFAWIYQEYIREGEKNIYGTKLIKIPAPEFYVLYNGKAKVPEVREQKLSDAFMVPSEGYEWTAKVLNINADYGAEIKERCSVLDEYSVFVETVRCYAASGMRREDAIDKAIDECIENDVLREYLGRERRRVRNMILEGFDQDFYERALRREGVEEGMEKGRAEGELKKQDEMILSFLGKGFSASDIAEAAKVPVEYVEKLQRKRAS